MKTSKAVQSLTQDQRFFYEHAGYSYKAPETATQGRIRCAIELAQAEEYALNLNWEFEWDWDECPDLSWMSEEEQNEDHEVLCARIVNPDDRRHSLASVCGITDPDSNYRRVIEAQLASEALADYDKETETLDAH
jgi:hypothetical protein